MIWKDTLRKALNREKLRTVVVKSPTEREQKVLEIWGMVTKPSRVFRTTAETEAYLAGIADEKKAQNEYDQLLREAGLR